MVRALTERSRLLQDALVQVPAGLYRTYLRELAEGGPIGPPPPVAWLAEEGRYRLVLDAERRGRLEAAVAVRVLRWQECRNVPVLSAAWAWGNVTVNGKPADLPTAGGWLRFMPSASQAGRYTISASAAVKQGKADGDALALEMPQTALTVFRFESPAAWEVQAEGAAGMIRRGASGGGASGGVGGTAVELAFAPRDNMRIEYRRPVILPPRPPRFEIGGAVAWNLDVGWQQVAARLRVAIIGGRTDRLELSLPADARQVSITGPDIREVRLSPSGGPATVFLRGEIAGQMQVDLRYDLPLAKGGIQRLDRVEIAGGHWTQGVLAISSSSGDSEILAHAMSGLRDVHPMELPTEAQAILAGRCALAYAITSRDFAAAVDVVNLGELAMTESIADLAHYQLLYRPDGSILAKADYEIRNRNRQFLRVSLPAGSRILAAKVNEKPQPLTPAPGASDAFLLPLERSKASVKGLVSFPVQVVFICRAGGLGRTGEVVLPLPRIDVPVAYGWCELHVPDGMSVRTWTGPLRQVERYSSETAVASLGYGSGEMAEGYRMEDRPTAEGRARPAAEPGRAGPAAPPAVVLSPAPAPTPAPLVAPTVAPPVAPSVAQRLAPAPLARFETALSGRRPADGPATRPQTDQPAQAAPVQPTPGELPAVRQHLETGVQVAQVGTGLVGGQMLLGRNYYRAGRDLYERGDYGNAAEALQKAAELAPNTAEAGNAMRLLANIRMVQGKSDAQSRQEKAAGKQVKEELAAANVELAQQQQELLTRGRTAAQSGKLGEAKVQLEAAQAVGQQLLAQGADVREQSIILRQTTGDLEKIRQVEGTEAGEIRLRYKAAKESGQQEKALQLGRQLQRIAAVADDPSLQTDLEELALKAVQARSRSQTDLTTGAAYEPLAAGRWVGRGAPPAERAAPSEDMAPKAREGDYAWVARDAQDAKAVERHERLIEDLPRRADEVERQPGATRVIELKHGDAQGLARTLTNLFGGEAGTAAAVRPRPTGAAARPAPVIAADPARGRITVRADDETFQLVRAIVGVLDRAPAQAAREGYGVALKNADPATVAETLNRLWASSTSGRGQQDESGAITIRVDPAGNYLIVRGPENERDRLIGLIAQLDAAEAPPEGAQPPAGVPLVRVYDIRDLLAGGSGLGPAAGQRAAEAAAGDDDRRKAAEELVNKVQSTLTGALNINSGAVQFSNGALIVTAGEGGHRLTSDLLGALRQVRGPNVQVGANIAAQRAGGTLGLNASGFVGHVSADFALPAVRPPANQPDQRAKDILADPQFQEFLTANYDWRLRLRDGGWAYDEPTSAYFRRADGTLALRPQARETGGRAVSAVPLAGRVSAQDSRTDLSSKLMLNLGQQVAVNSRNIGVEAAAAAGLGLSFVAGANGVVYAVADEAQVRTLRELESRRAGKGAPTVAPNERRQYTIVGTDALLANGDIANVAFAGDRGNKIDVNGNTVALPHDRYIIIDNGGYLTAIQTGTMLHWSQWRRQAAAVGFAEVPQEIDIPAVGRLVKFEKTLIGPSDELVIRAMYTWTGEGR